MGCLGLRRQSRAMEQYVGFTRLGFGWWDPAGWRLEESMKPNLSLILAIGIGLGALPLTTVDSRAVRFGGGGGHFGGGHFGGGHFGGGHFGGGHFGGGHFGGGHFGGGHFAGGHFRGGYFGGRHFAGGHFRGGHFGGGHFAGGHFGGSHFGGGRFGGGQFAGGRQFGGRSRSGLNGNAFGTAGGWNGLAGNGGAGGWGGGWGGWGGGWGGWGGWVGPVFWPFLLGDLFSYALWPYDYDYPFWSYGAALDYDYGPYVPAYGYYGYNGLSNIYGYSGYATGGGHVRYATRAGQIPPDVTQIPPDVTQSCGGFAPGVTSFPIDQIRQAIQPTGEQITFLDDLAAASSKASAIINSSCPSEPPLTPLARLDAVERRLEATVQAIEIVRPPLVNLYASLSDEQRQRLDAIGAKEARYGSGAAARGSSGATALASLCGDQATNFTRVPSQRIQEIVKPTGPQESALEDLKQASAKAADELRASCPKQSAESLVARLDDVTSQLDGMVRAAKSLHPTLATFYASLSDEQKAQFNNMGYSGPPGGKG
jgi:LTXXQ motif family protein